MSKAILFVVVLFLVPMITMAQESTGEDSIVSQVVNAYGGEKLLQMQAFRLVDNYKAFRYGQSHRPDSVDMLSNRAATTVDLTRNRIDFRWIREFQDHFVAQHQMFNGSLGYRIEHASNTWQLSDNISFARADRFHTLFLDTRLAQLMSQANATISVKETILHRGETLKVVDLEPAGLPKLTLYINAQNGLIKKMTRPSWRPDMGFEYQYSNHTAQQGITYAKDFYVTRGGNPFYVSTQRQVDWGLDASSEQFRQYFRVPKHYVQGGKSIDFSSMTVTALSTNLYLVGKEWGFSLFYEADDHFVATGGYEGLTDRLNALNQFIGKNKPLKYQIITHHHTDHLSGMPEVAELGAKFVTVAANIDSIQEQLEQPLPDERFIIVDKQLSLLDNKIQILDFPNGHANHNLLSYFPDEKVIFSADLFISRQKTGTPEGYPGLIDFKQAYEAAGFKPTSFAASHSGRVLTLEDLNDSISKIQKQVCPPDWTICP